jgi:hypothetical protein
MVPGATTWALALVLLSLLAWVPGALVVAALRPESSLLDRVAVAPAVSIGIAATVGSYVERLRHGTGLAAAGAALAVMGLAAVIPVARRGGLRAVLVPRRWRPVHTVVASAIAASLVIDAVVIARSATGWGAVVPRIDGTTHGMYVGRILATGSLDPVVVTATDTASGTGGLYYPLGLHTLAALAGTVTGGAVALTAVGFLAGSVWAPLAIAAWTRRIAGPTTAAAAAVVIAVATPWLLMAQGALGLWPLVAGVALVPAVAAVALDTRFTLGLLVPAIAVAGLLAVHTTELVPVAMLVGLTVVAGPPARWLRDLAAPAVGMALGLLVVVPLITSVLTGRGQAIDEAAHVPWSQAVTEVLTLPVLGQQGPLAEDPTVVTAIAGAVWWVLVAVGCGVLWRTRAARGTVLTIALLAVLSLAGSVGLAHVLTFPWYDIGTRILAQCAALAAIPLAAAALAVVGRARRTGEPWRATALVGTAAAAVLAALLVGTVVRAGDLALTGAVVSADDRAAFAWLEAHAKPGERVLNQWSDGSAWVYADTTGAVSTVFGARTTPWFTLDPAWAGRVHLLQHVADYATDDQVRAEAARWSVRYVVVGDDVVPGFTADLHVAQLEHAAGIREVFRSGGSAVFELGG